MGGAGTPHRTLEANAAVFTEALSTRCAILITSVFWTLYTSVDVVLLSKLCDSDTVGVYTTPSRIFGTLLVIPVTITTVLFPRLSAHFQHYSAMLHVTERH